MNKVEKETFLNHIIQTVRSEILSAKLGPAAKGLDDRIEKIESDLEEIKNTLSMVDKALDAKKPVARAEKRKK